MEFREHQDQKTGEIFRIECYVGEPYQIYRDSRFIDPEVVKRAKQAARRRGRKAA